MYTVNEKELWKCARVQSSTPGWPAAAAVKARDIEGRIYKNFCNSIYYIDELFVNQQRKNSHNIQRTMSLNAGSSCIYVPLAHFNSDVSKYWKLNEAWTWPYWRQQN